MTTANSITYLPRSNDELTSLTQRLRAELDEHYSFAPKANARLEEVVLGTLGIPNGRQQWQSLLMGGSTPESKFHMSLFINVEENSEGDGGEEGVGYLELLLDDESVRRIEKIATVAREMDIDAEVRGIRFKDAPSDYVKVLITSEGYLCASFEKRVKHAWPITVEQTSDLTVDQILEACQVAKTYECQMTAFLPRFAQDLFLVEDCWDSNGDLKEVYLEAIESSHDVEVDDFFTSFSTSVSSNSKTHNEEAPIDVSSNCELILQLVNIYSNWLKNKKSFLNMHPSDKFSTAIGLSDLRDAIKEGRSEVMWDCLKDHENAIYRDGIKPDMWIEIRTMIDDYRKNGSSA